MTQIMQANFLTAVAPNHRIIQNKHFDTFPSGKGAEYAGYFYGKKQQKPCPVKKSVIQKAVGGILRSSLLPTFRIQELEKIFALKYQRKQKYFVCRDTTVLSVFALQSSFPS